ncbi:MAG: hypothetical protein HY023_06590 [Chloroflexi bacterium]|nr:hypothetical protein [Chloroflexota bacterium]
MAVRDLQSPEVAQALKTYTVVYKDGEPVAVQLEISLFLRLLDALEDLITLKLPEESGVVNMIRETRGRYLTVLQPQPLEEMLGEAEGEEDDLWDEELEALYGDVIISPRLMSLRGSLPPLALEDEKGEIVEAVTRRKR